MKSVIRVHALHWRLDQSGAHFFYHAKPARNAAWHSGIFVSTHAGNGKETTLPHGLAPVKDEKGSPATTTLSLIFFHEKSPLS